MKSRTAKQNSGTVTISASVPSILVQEIRDRVGSREFSQFVTNSLRRELIRLNQLKFVADFEREVGPLDPKDVDEFSRMLDA